MNYNVKPLKKYAEISYRVKCVTVENERVFGDVYVAQQTRDVVHWPDGYPLPPVYKRRRRNLIKHTLNGPDFMELNSKGPTESAGSRWQKRSKSMGDEPSMIAFNYENVRVDHDVTVKKPKIYPSPLQHSPPQKEIVITSLVDQLLLDIYGIPMGDRGRSESDSTASSLKPRPQHQYLQKARLLLKRRDELQILLVTLRDHISHTGGLLIRQLRRKDYLTVKRDKQCDIITAYLQAHSAKRFEDTKMRFSLTPQPGESGFIQWLDAMKMVAKLQGGIPPEFRKRLWLTLAERHLEQRGVDWKQAEKVCFNEWSNPDDEELGIQIVKDLHRTGCSLFCGAAGRDNQAVLRRVLLGFARWNKSVGYCQGLNVLAALVLQVMDRAESSAVKVMIYLIEGVLPEGYFADNLRGLSVDMAVFRDLLRSRLPKLSKHLEALQSDAKDKATGSSYEPPLTNVFTMQWFLTLFCHCLPQEAVLRVWDLIFLEGDEVLLRTALAIWEGLSDRIMTVTSADEFYSIMGVLTREMLEFTDTNNLIKNIVGMGPLHGVTSLREKHRYNITPWARKLSDDDDSETEEDERLAVAAAMFSMAQRIKKDRIPSTIGALQAMAPSSDRERLALDISTLKQQYAKLRERQRQAHIILSAACARQTMVPPPTSTAMNHLLVGKNALVSGKNRPLSLPPATGTSKLRSTALHSPRNQSRREKQGVTLHWKDAKRPKQRAGDAGDADAFGSAFLQSPPETTSTTSPNRSTADSDSDSTSTELCDEPEHLSDVDSEELTSASDSYVLATDDEKHACVEGSSTSASTPARSYVRSEPMTTTEVVPRNTDSILVIDRNDEVASLTEISIAKITDQIRRLSAEDDNNTTVPQTQKARGNDELPVQDYSVEKSQMEMDSKLPDPVDYTLLTSSSADATNSSSKNYLSLKSNLVEERTSNILHRTDRLKDTKEEEDIIRVSSRNITGLKTNVTEISANTSRDDFKDQTTSSLDRNYDKFIAPLDTSDKPFESSLRFSSRVYLDSRNDNDSNDMDTSSRALDVAADSRSFYSKRYIMGHLPISPITMDNKLTKLSHDIYNVAANPEVCLTNPETTLRRDITFGNDQPTIQTKSYSDLKRSPKSPESTKSFSSGETMGPDTKPSSLTMSPRTPIRSDSRDFTINKSACSSISSDSKTLVLHSASSDIAHDDSMPIAKKTSYDRTSPSISTDSLRNKSDTSPKLVISSSSDSTCSPSKVRSSERSFSSDLQSPVSANSIRYTTSYGKRGQDNVSDSPIDLSAATSPFYPIANPNQKTPSPYGVSKQQRCSVDSADTSPDLKSISSKDSTKFSGYQAKLDLTTKSIETKEREVSDGESERNDLFARPQFELNAEMNAGYTSKERSKADLSSYESIGGELYRKRGDFADDNADDPLSEKDVVPQLPHEKLDKHYLSYNYRRRDRSKLTERSSSSLERRCTDLKFSTSSDEFSTTMAKKRSSDILEDMKHLEAKAFSDGLPDTTMLTKKSSDIWEDMKNLEARRQDTFSNSASGFSKRRLEIPDINVTSEGRKSYVVHPKINIDENSDSILKTISCNKNTDSDTDDGRESKVGVWTKVKPRKKGDNGRRSSDRALKIIQENSAILHKILACQAKKRLPDLEEISKEITISPINEEISKIFSPILEKMGLNEHEINEELARINFKDFDNMSATSVSEFDAKINEELTKLSLIDDAEQIDHLGVDEIISHDYLDTREALIDHKINEELSKLLANYEEESPPSMINLDKGSSSQNISEIEGLDLTSISTNVFSYKSSNDSIETRSDQESVHEAVVQPVQERFPFATLKYEQSLSPKSDIDIYRELEKLDKISFVHVLPNKPVEISPKRLSPITYVTDASPYPEVPSATRYAPKTSPYDIESATTSLKSTYEPYKSFDFANRPSPRDNLYTYDKPTESTFDYTDSKTRFSIDPYDLHVKNPILSKESLEFRVKYDDESSRSTSSEYAKSAQDSRSTVSLDTGSSYYGKSNDKAVTPTKYISKEEKRLDIEDYPCDKPDLLRHKYSVLSPKEFSHVRDTDYDKPLGILPHVMVDSESDIGSYLPTRYRDYNVLSPNRQYRDHYFPSSPNHYTSKLSPGLAEEAQRPTSHPESPSKISAGKYEDLTSKGSNCYKKSTLSLGSIDSTNKSEKDVDTTPSPKTHFSPFPVRNNTRKPKELTLKLGLYSPQSSDFNQVKKS
ncbi:TBC1 domain family member [Ooceraea biroi]|uniref:TBC1 domain family member 30 n=1 Tax=Ooceraea biroi TaxID=2015173 RepID=A0A026X2H7_OOCBI|nr:TBC1 domain family member [Ooceraea biroi]